MARTTVVGACPHDCPDTCSILTTVEDGKAVAVRGNPDHPFTRGRLCVKVNNYQDRVYSEQRLLYPMRRTGPKGSGRFERITWDDAIAEIASRFKDIIATDGAQAILPLQLSRHAGYHQRAQCRRSAVQQARCQRLRTHVLRFRILHRLYDDHRPHARR